MAEEKLLTLEETYTKFKEIQSQIKEMISNVREGLALLDQAIKEIDDLYPTTDNEKDKDELRNYKSSILQIKSEYGSQLQYLQPQLNGIEEVLSLLDKSIKINSGEIF